MGYKSDKDISERVLNKLKESIGELKNNIILKINWDKFTFHLNETEKKIEFNNNLSIQNKKVFDNLRGADEIVVAIGTMGNLLDEKSKEYIAKNDYLKVIIFDAISEAVMDNIKRSFEFELGKKYNEKGMGKTHGFYPGSNGWNLEDQKIIFSLLDSDSLDVKLNENFIMIPTKSFSVVYGAGKKIITKAVGNKCMYCNLKSCRFRNKDTDENC